MNKCKINIWKRAFELSVVYECYPDEEVLGSQEEAFDMLKKNTSAIAEALDAVKNYVRKTGDPQSVDDPIKNIFKYVMPKSIFVPHNKNHRMAAIMCNYKFDMEHGLAVTFENGQFKKVGPQDIVL